MDIVIVGTGPAGTQAAIHAARMKVKVAMIGKRTDSAMHGAHIENYFGTGKMNGSEMLDTGISQAVSFGTELIEENVISLKSEGGTFTAVTESGTEISAKAVILASGISRKKLNIPGEKEYFGKGVSYCAECDCNFYKGKKVAVIGDESEAAAAAELMTRYASYVCWISKEPKVSDIMIKRAKAAGVDIIREDPKEIHGKNGKVEKIEFTDRSMVNADGVFIELGARSSSDLAMDVNVIPNTNGTVNVNERCETSVPGVYACGDITGRPWQVARAVGQGAVAGMNASEFVKGEKNVS